MTTGATEPGTLREIGAVPLIVAFLGGPLIWALHLALSYFLVALDCGTAWDGARNGIVIATIICAVAALAAGLFAGGLWNRLRRHNTRADDLDPPRAREFLALSGAIIAPLFVGAIVLAGISPLFLSMCT